MATMGKTDHDPIAPFATGNNHAAVSHTHDMGMTDTPAAGLVKRLIGIAARIVSLAIIAMAVTVVASKTG